VELVIFCGSPGAGKSTYYWNHLEPLGYERVNQDILKTVCTSTINHRILPNERNTDQTQRPKCLKVAREHLEAKKSVVVGTSNPTSIPFRQTPN
jgi:bifunctional polynucleotide phosphatase/kinase